MYFVFSPTPICILLKHSYNYFSVIIYISYLLVDTALRWKNISGTFVDSKWVIYSYICFPHQQWHYNSLVQPMDHKMIAGMTDDTLVPSSSLIGCRPSGDLASTGLACSGQWRPVPAAATHLPCRSCPTALSPSCSPPACRRPLRPGRPQPNSGLSCRTGETQNTRGPGENHVKIQLWGCCVEQIGTSIFSGASHRVGWHDRFFGLTEYFTVQK